ncbi:XkdX family protein [Ligilactobacillus salivarius]|uniref:XkdX family protein n=1 Tax=Ligilactobacillus salivarius TaxID=1624 RepID=UPI003F240E25
MMTQMQMLQMFWNDWGNHDLAFYRVYVDCGAITKTDYKEVTGHDYDEGATPESESTPVTSSQA